MGIRFSFKFLICDKPAKSMCLNFQSHSAKYFFPLCLATSRVETIREKRHQYIPLNNFFDQPPRSHSGFLSLASSTNEYLTPEYGVKGYCFLTNINSIYMTESNVIDYMHSICLGIIKKCLDLSLTDHRFNQDFFNSMSTINKLKFPASISINCINFKNIKLWKAKDYRTYILFIIPFLWNRLPKEIFELFMLLREGLFDLFSENITGEMSNESSRVFKKFVFNFASLFKEHNLSANFHDLAHISNVTLKSGPIYSFSAFNFEHLNGRLARLCKGTKRLDKQLLFKIQNFISSYNHSFVEGSDLEKFKHELFESKNGNQHIIFLVS